MFLLSRFKCPKLTSLLKETWAYVHSMEGKGGRMLKQWSQSSRLQIPGALMSAVTHQTINLTVFMLTFFSFTKQLH